MVGLQPARNPAVITLSCHEIGCHEKFVGLGRNRLFLLTRPWQCPGTLPRRCRLLVVHTPGKAAGRGAREEQYLDFGAELGIALRWGRAAPACLWSLGRAELSRGTGLACEGTPVPVNQLQAVAVQVWWVRDQLVLDMNFWNLIPSALKL